MKINEWICKILDKIFIQKFKHPDPDDEPIKLQISIKDDTDSYYHQCQIRKKNDCK